MEKRINIGALIPADTLLAECNLAKDKKNTHMMIFRDLSKNQDNLVPLVVSENDSLRAIAYRYLPRGKGDFRLIDLSRAEETIRAFHPGAKHLESN